MKISNKNHHYVFSRLQNEGTYRSSSKSSWIMFFWVVEMVETEGCREQRRTRLASITQTTNSLAVSGCWIAGDHPCDIGRRGAIIFSARGWFDDVFSYKNCWRANSFFFQNPPQNPQNHNCTGSVIFLVIKKQKLMRLCFFKPSVAYVWVFHQPTPLGKSQLGKSSQPTHQIFGPLQKIPLSGLRKWFWAFRTIKRSTFGSGNSVRTSNEVLTSRTSTFVLFSTWMWLFPMGYIYIYVSYSYQRGLWSFMYY